MLWADKAVYQQATLAGSRQYTNVVGRRRDIDMAVQRRDCHHVRLPKAKRLPLVSDRRICNRLTEQGKTYFEGGCRTAVRRFWITFLGGSLWQDCAGGGLPRLADALGSVSLVPPTPDRALVMRTATR